MDWTPLTTYLRRIVKPTIEDFEQNPTSLRHAYLACVAIFHAVDRAAEILGEKPSTLRQEWRKFWAFHVVDTVAHDFKHVRASPQGRGLPPLLVYGRHDPHSDENLPDTVLRYVQLAYGFIGKTPSRKRKRRRRGRVRLGRGQTAT